VVVGIDGSTAADHALDWAIEEANLHHVPLTVVHVWEYPYAPIGAEPVKLAIPVADGCGFNRYRDARGICRKKYVITRHRGRQPFYTGCGGLNSHRVCNLYGHCWMVCD
jgi:hypothetical protein